MKKGVIALLLVSLIILSQISLIFSLSEYNLTYDSNGNLITGDGKYREYNEFNQLVVIRDGNNVTGQILEKYIYHPTKDRILVKQIYPIGYAVPNETIIYANENFVRKITKPNPTGNIVNMTDTIYVKDENGIVAEFNSSQNKLYYYNDHLGSTSVITNESGSIIEETFYEPFGGVMSGGNLSRFYYEGKDLSHNTNEYDFNFRKYSPELKIFTKPDAIISNVYDPQSLNRYSFERNNPYKYVDKDGKVIFFVIAGVAVTYTLVETLIDAASFIYSAYEFIKDPDSIVNSIALTADIIDIASGSLSNPGPSGFMVHGVEFSSKRLKNFDFGKPIFKFGRSKMVPSLINTFYRDFGVNLLKSVASSYFYGLEKNYFDYTSSNKIDDTGYFNGYSSYNPRTGVYCEDGLCQSTLYPPNSGSSGGFSSRADDDRPSDEYCNTYSDKRC